MLYDSNISTAAAGKQRFSLDIFAKETDLWLVTYLMHLFLRSSHLKPACKIIVFLYKPVKFVDAGIRRSTQPPDTTQRIG
jgi:hypothetical protein